MNKKAIFCLGFISGIIALSFIIVIAQHSHNQITEIGPSIDGNAALPDDITILEEPLPFTETNIFRIEELAFDDAAFALSGKQHSLGIIYGNPIVLILSDQCKSFYDNKVVTIPENFKVEQIGTYKNNHKKHTSLKWDVVPIIRFVEK